MRNRFGQHQGNAFALVRQIGVVGSGLEDQDVAFQNLDHFRVADIQGTTACQMQAKGSKWLSLDVAEHGFALSSFRQSFRLYAATAYAEGMYPLCRRRIREKRNRPEGGMRLSTR